MKSMKISPLRRSRRDGAGVVGTVRLGRHTTDLARRLNPGDIAVIDHTDLDRTSAEQLVACQVAAVVNASESTSGRFPNLGPGVITAAGILLIDNVGDHIFGLVKEGDKVRIDEGTLTRADQEVATGEVLDAARVGELMTDARTGLAAQLESFAATTMEHLRREHPMLLDGVGVPAVRTPMRERHVLVVVRGYDYQRDLRLLRHYIRDQDPVLIGVDAGADALLEAGHRPHLVVGDPELLSAAALTCGAEVVMHVARGASSSERLERLQVHAVGFDSSGTSEDAALLLANRNGASLVVAVGTRATLLELLDRGRSGMASNYLTRLKLGATLVDTRAVLQLYRTKVATWQLLFLLLAGLVAVAVAVATTPLGATWSDHLGVALSDVVHRIRGLV